MQDLGVVQHDALPKPVRRGLNQHVPLQVAEGVGPDTISIVGHEEIATLVERHMEIANNLPERDGIPSYDGAVGAALGLDGVFSIVDDLCEVVEVVGQASHVPPEFDVLPGYRIRLVNVARECPQNHQPVQSAIASRQSFLV